MYVRNRTIKLLSVNLHSCKAATKLALLGTLQSAVREYAYCLCIRNQIIMAHASG
jgi:hypothetical protein